jgi:hypothetical protein
MGEKDVNSGERRVNPFLLVVDTAGQKLIPPKIRDRLIVFDVVDNVVSKFRDRVKPPVF